MFFAAKTGHRLGFTCIETRGSFERSSQALIPGEARMLKKDKSEIRCYDYVNHPYQRVRDRLSRDALSVFQAATKSAVSRAHTVATELHVDLGGLGIKADVNVSVRNIEERIDAIPSPVTRLLLEWEAATMPGLFPFMKAELSIYPLTASETQLDFFGHYEPPFGAVGRAMNAIAGYRIAEVSVHRFIREVAEHLRATLTSETEGKGKTA